MTKHLLMSFLLLSSCLFSYAQPAPSFIKYYTPSFEHHSSYGFDVVQTHDKGYAMVGCTLFEKEKGIGSKMMLYRTNPTGDLLWIKDIPFSFPCEDKFGYAVEVLHDGSFLIAGTCGYELVLVKTNSEGDTLWTKKTGISVGNEFNVNLSLTADGGFAVSGSANYQMVLAKFDGSGSLLWTKKYGYKDSQNCNDMKATTDGGYILAGTQGFGILQAYILKINSLGDTVWTSSWNDTGDGLQVTAVSETSDGGYLCMGGNVINGFFLKLNAAGKTEWWLNNPDYLPHGIYEDPGKAWYSFSWRNDYLLGMQKINYSGTGIIWSEVYNFLSPSYAGNFALTADKGFVLTGYGRNENDSSQVILIKVDSTDNFQTGTGAAQQMFNLRCYPNPANDQVTIEHDQLMVSVVLRDISGRIVRTYPEKSKTLDIRGLVPGVYFLQLQSREGVRAEKIIIK